MVIESKNQGRNSIQGNNIFQYSSSQVEYERPNTHRVTAMDRYSASTEEQETMGCFLVLKKMGEPPKKTRKPVTEGRSNGITGPIKVTIVL